MLKMQLDPFHWYVVRTSGQKGEISEGTRGLANALVVATKYINERGVRRVVVFNGQPSDGAKIVAIVDLDGC